MYSFVALDVETANNFRGSICSIGLVKFQDGHIIDKFYSLIDPEEDFHPINISIHGIKPTDVIGAPTFPQIRAEIIDFISDFPVVAHFAQFDINALKDSYIKYDLPFDKIEYFCSYYVAKFSYPGQISYKLNNLAKHFKFPLEHHNALSDAETCGKIICKLMELANQDDIQSFLETLRYKKYGVLGSKGFGRQSIHTTFSKNKFYEPTEEEKAKMDQENPIYGARFVFTGKLEHFTRQEAAKAVSLLGGIPENGVTSKTDYLVIGEQDFRVVGQSGQSSKMKKAFSLLEKGQNIEILSELDFQKLIG
ncbi:exonuclease domain-containing protein [Streptococcus pneumoniae]